MTKFSSDIPRDELTVVLHGGPKDGAIMTISPDILALGRLRVPILQPIRWEENPSIVAPPVKIGVYKWQRKFAGEPNTCEFRTWTEWHYEGEH